MRRAMERQQQAAQLDAAAVLRELDSQDALSGDDEGDGYAGQLAQAPGRLSFGGPAAVASAAEVTGACVSIEHESGMSAVLCLHKPVKLSGGKHQGPKCAVSQTMPVGLLKSGGLEQMQHAAQPAACTMPECLCVPVCSLMKRMARMLTHQTSARMPKPALPGTLRHVLTQCAARKARLSGKLHPRHCPSARIRRGALQPRCREVCQQLPAVPPSSSMHLSSLGGSKSQHPRIQSIKMARHGSACRQIRQSASGQLLPSGLHLAVAQLQGQLLERPLLRQNLANGAAGQQVIRATVLLLAWRQPPLLVQLIIRRAKQRRLCKSLPTPCSRSRVIPVK